MQRQPHSDPVRSCAQFRNMGEPDPLRGDAPYQRVRDLARETLNAIFNTVPNAGGGSAGGKAPSSAIKLQSMGSDDADGNPTSFDSAKSGSEGVLSKAVWLGRNVPQDNRPFGFSLAVQQQQQQQHNQQSSPRNLAYSVGEESSECGEWRTNLAHPLQSARY